MSGSAPAGSEAPGPALGVEKPRSPSSRLLRAALIAASVGCGCTLVAVLGFEVANRSVPSAGSEAFAYRPGAVDGALPRLWNVPEFSFDDQTRPPITPAALTGNVWIANFIFTTCTSVCPLLSAK